MNRPLVLCLLLPDIRLAAAWQEEPALRNQPLVLGGHPWERRRVVAASLPARAQGVRVDMGLRQAEQLCPEAVFRPLPETAAAAWDALARRLYALTPDLELNWPDRIHLRPEPVEVLHGGRRAALAAVVEAVRAQVGVRPRWGLSCSRLAAGLAARGSGPGREVAAGRERAFLGPLPINTLPLSPEVLEELRALGLDTLGQLARLPLAGLRQRFGEEGRRAGILARGMDGAALTPWRPTATHDWAASFEPALEDRGGLAFALRRAGVELGGWLASQALGSEGFTVRFGFESGEVLLLERHLPGQVRGPEELARPAIALAESAGLDRPVISIEMRLHLPTPARGRQLSLLVRHDGVGEDLRQAALRLEERLGAPVLGRLSWGQPDSPLPDRQASLVLGGP